ncbi:MAG TPA: malto-oligosyltrehalose synthase [Candidatus Acidoferrum sp.]|nr:malto-oligosyltrehalose synthase [Candidatus Acidoferrum sp.]
MTVPSSTYRFQFNKDFTLRQAKDLVPYLHKLGISHIYASPLLKACPGSTHGYDICDHSLLNPEIGTERELEELVGTLRSHDMGLVLDIVPNHMGICGRHNAWWWDVLKHGRNSAFAGYFDIEWDSPDPRQRGKVLTPVLGDTYGHVLERKELRLAREDGEVLLAYVDKRFPLAPESLPSPEPDAEELERLNGDLDALDAVIQKQHYRLADWHRGDSELNYRRFFNIWTLPGIRIEDPRVFGAAHALVLSWYAKGWIDGFRVDHPDGLRDPTEYLKRLRAAAPEAWIVAEKILQPGESVPEEWPVAGTTGYEFMRRVTELFVDHRAEKPLTDVYVDFTGEPTDYGAVVREKQRLVLGRLFEAEVNWLTRMLLRVAARHWRYRDLAEADLREALIDVAARLPVYCTYVQAHLGRVPEADAAVIAETVSWGRHRRRTLPPEAFDFIEDLLLLRLRGELEQEFVVHFQQLTGPTMAKGAEDTACYCFNRLLALNIVGGDPSRFGMSPEEVHERFQQAQERCPHAMLTTSTHDTKRSGDVGMRLCVLSEVPQDWRRTVFRWSALNAKHRRGEWPDRNMEYFYYQTLVGAWPLSLERALPIMEKSAHEAKQHTSWTRPDPEYDTALRGFVTGTLRDPQFVAEVERFVAQLLEPGQVNSLASTLLKLTAPGVPDTYQGEELWELSLVDPDNRRPVDFATRQRWLDELERLSVEQVWRRRDEGVPKLWLIWKVLPFRRSHRELFGAESSYQPLPAQGPQAARAFAFARGGRIVTLVPRLVTGLRNGWGETTLRLPEGRWRNELTGEEVTGGERHVGELLRQFPVALFSKG